MIDALEEGADAYAAGKPETVNPYDLATQEALHLDWNDGWNMAYEDALK